MRGRQLSLEACRFPPHLELCGGIVGDIARRRWVTYGLPFLVHGDTGSRYNGNDYYQAMIMSSFPALLED